MIRALSLTAVLAAAISLPAAAQLTPTQPPTGPSQVPATPTTPSPAPTAPNRPAAPTAMAPASTDIMLTEEQVKSWIGKPVYSSDDKKIGEVIAFARGSDNKVTEMHAGIGGFLGMGETTVRLMPAQIKLSADRVILNVTSAQAKDLPKLVK